MKYTQLLITWVPNSPPPSKHSWTNRSKIIDAGHTNSYVKLCSHWIEFHQIFTRHREMIFKYLHKIEIAIVQSLSGHQCAEWITIVKLQPSRSEQSTISFCKLRSYWTNVNQFFWRYRAVIAATNAYINKVILHPVSDVTAKSEGGQFQSLCVYVLVAIATSLWLRQTLCQINNCQTHVYQCWKYGKDWYGTCWGILWAMAISCVVVAKLCSCCHLEFFNLKNTGVLHVL